VRSLLPVLSTVFHSFLVATFIQTACISLVPSHVLSFATVISKQWRSQPKNWVGRKNFGGAKVFDFRRITLFCLEKRLSKHKMTIFSKNLGGNGPFCPPGCAYVSKRCPFHGRSRASKEKKESKILSITSPVVQKPLVPLGELEIAVKVRIQFFVRDPNLSEFGTGEATTAVLNLSHRTFLLDG